MVMIVLISYDAISVVDGDDMSRYDFGSSAAEDREDEEEALYQLEWELASQAGMIDGG